MAAINSVLVSMLLILSMSPASAAKECNQLDAYAAETVTDYLNSWDNVHRFFKQFHHCFDGSIAEGTEDQIQKLWSDQWTTLPKMIELTRKNPEFKSFIWQRINDETFPRERFDRVVSNSKTKCPPVAIEFCRAVIAAASQPINRQDD